jgi:hypothetical protein
MVEMPLANLTEAAKRIVVSFNSLARRQHSINSLKQEHIRFKELRAWLDISETDRRK